MKQRFTHPFLSFVQFFTALVLVAAALGVPQRTAQSASTIVYVVPGGAGDRTGTSWANARDLATALDGASSGMELWVKGGTYKPTAAFPMYPKQATFTLKSGVALYGGFAGTETVRDQRNPTANETILSGVIDSSTRITHVVTAINVDATAVLDGFKITDGKADGSESGVSGYQNGGGMYLENSSPTLANLIIRLNSAQYYGGGMYLTGSSPTLTNVTIENNTVSNGGGGGMYNLNSNPVLSTVSFNNNNAGSGMGGGILNYNSHPTLTGATFYSNTAGSGGGGISNSNGSSILLTNVTFEGNIAVSGSGGGVDNIGSSSAALTNVTFHLNIVQSSTGMGGGMFSNGGSVTLSQVTCDSNSARSSGGGMYLESGAAELTDVVFVGNSNASESQPTYGGGMYIKSASPRLTRVIFRENA
ncbi:MAG: right-handed parallel beta-helix repeat-containing protein, partial [Anaerolineaceae bacterium]